MNVGLEYRDRVAAMSAVERVRRADALFRWSRDYLARSILAGEGPISDDLLRCRIAYRQYGTSRSARTLIDELVARVSG